MCRLIKFRLNALRFTVEQLSYRGFAAQFLLTFHKSDCCKQDYLSTAAHVSKGSTSNSTHIIAKIGACS